MQYYGDSQMRETIRFVLTFDRFFYCLNTRHPKEGILKRKPDLNPYTSPTDERLTNSILNLCTVMSSELYNNYTVASRQCTRLSEGMEV